jgi:hypothetical protein
VLSLAATPALAVHDLGLFELDGNAVEPNAAGDLPGDDWETLFNGGGSASVFTGITADPAPQSIFTGGRKDIQDIDQWGWKDGAVPDKSDITNAYAAAYDDNGDLIVYFGADRVANAGDTFLGFWFFKSAISLNPDGSFEGLHQPGDTLVLVNFPQAANAVPLIRAVEWDPTCSKADSNNPQVDDCAAKNLRLRAGVEGAGAICGSTANDLACAITNEEFTANASPGLDSASPWPYTSKDGTVGEFPFETFFEGGINLTQLIGGDACFSGFMAETRSSKSFTASLKDFVLDAFPVCSISVTKACSNPRLNVAQDMIIYDISGAVTNEGFGTVHDVTVTDSPPFDAGSLQFDEDPASLAGDTSLGYNATITVSLAENGRMDMVTATANTTSDGTGTTLSDTATATCPQLQISPSIAVTKTCTSAVSIIDIVDPSQPAVVAQIDVAGQVCNDGDSKLTNVAVTDDKAGTLLSGVTLLAGECEPYSATYTPSEANDINGDPTNDPTAVVFSDTATASGTDIFGMSVMPQSAMAMCPLCP